MRTTMLAGLLLLAPVVHAGELTLGLGESVNNSSAHERDTAWSAEYRRVFGERYAWSVAYLNEGHKPSLKRDGVAGGLWAVTETNGWSLSAGAGAYAALTTRTEGGTDVNRHRLNGLVGATVGRRFVDCSLRLSWQRVLASASASTDNFLVGVGFPID